MNDARMSQEGLRRAALSLHGLAEQDRSWVLAALRPEQRAMLQPMLAELRELGIPADAALHGTLLDGPARVLDAQDLAALAGVLREEPPKLGAILLRLGGTAQAPALQSALLAAARRRLASELQHRPAMHVRLWRRVTSGLRRRWP